MMLISLDNYAALSCLCLWLWALPLPSCLPNVQYHWCLIWKTWNFKACIKRQCPFILYGESGLFVKKNAWPEGCKNKSDPEVLIESEYLYRFFMQKKKNLIIHLCVSFFLAPGKTIPLSKCRSLIKISCFEYTCTYTRSQVIYFISILRHFTLKKNTLFSSVSK
jgi:hypothetical protein